MELIIKNFILFFIITFYSLSSIAGEATIGYSKSSEKYFKVTKSSTDTEEGEYLLTPSLKKVTNFTEDPKDLRFRKSERNKRTPKRLFFGIKASPTILEYKESIKALNQSLNQRFITLGFNMHYALEPGVWSLGLSGFHNSIALGGQQPSTLRFLGLNLRLGYILPVSTEVWNFSIHGGIYRLSTQSTGTKIGFTQVNGPQLYPLVQYKINKNWSSYSYFKYSPVSTQFSLATFTSYELAGGLGLMNKISPETALGWTIDVSRLSISLPLINYTSITNTFSSGLQYTF